MIPNLLTPELQAARAKFAGDDGIHWAPIRHHSPACSIYLRQLLDRVQPDAILIEGAVDFNRQLETLLHEQTVPPIALYGQNSFYPLYDTSPEWVALRWGRQHNKRLHFIDLPMADKAWQREERDHGGISFLREAYLQHSEFIQKLVRTTRCRHGDELWERWFELQRFDSPAQFFSRVFDYCTAARLTYSEQAIADSGDAEREQFMRGEIARHAKPGQRCVVVTGGFHSYALLDWHDSSSAKSQSESPSWLVRYSEDRLDALSGYNAGMPVPGFYRRLLQRRSDLPEDEVAAELLLQVLADLHQSPLFRQQMNTAAKQAVFYQVTQLQQLRGHAWPGLYDVLDGLRSVLIKHDSAGDEPLLKQACRLLAGDRLGQVSSDLPPLPLVDEVYGLLKRARFKLEQTTKVTTTFNIRQRDHERLALLYQCRFLGLDFAEKTAGPDWEHAVHLHLRSEEWQYAWTPWVEARLVDLSLTAPDWQSLLNQRIQEKLAELQDRTLAEHQVFFVQLLLMKRLDLAEGLWRQIGNQLNDCSDCGQLAEFLLLLLRLRQHQGDLLEQYAEPIRQVVELAWQQLMFMLPTLNTLETSAGLRLLLQIQEITRECAEALADAWQNAWRARLHWLAEFGELSAALRYACLALLAELGDGSPEELCTALRKLFDYDPEAAYQAVNAVITVAPHYLLHSDTHGLPALLNRLLAGWDEDRFLSALPELRLLFSHLDPAAIEKLSDTLCEMNGWQEAPAMFNADVDEQLLMQGRRLQQQLAAQLRAEGLDHWLET